MKFSIVFRPRLLDALKGYTREDFAKDSVAGLTVGLVALPLAMALAIATGLKPEVGLFTGVIAGFLISVLEVRGCKSAGPPARSSRFLLPSWLRTARKDWWSARCSPG